MVVLKINYVTQRKHTNQEEESSISTAVDKKVILKVTGVYIALPTIFFTLTY